MPALPPQKANVLPGDFCCVPIAGSVGFGIEAGQWILAVVDGWPRAAARQMRPYDHAEIYIGMPGKSAPHGYTVGAYPGGARKVALPCPAAELPGAIWSSGLIPLMAAQRAGVTAWATAHIGTPYSFLDYLAIAAHGLHLPIPGLRAYIAGSRHMICSQFADADYAANGVHLFQDGRWPGYVDPLDLADLLLSLSVKAGSR
jgi:hypothetical protein